MHDDLIFDPTALLANIPANMLIIAIRPFRGRRGAYEKQCAGHEPSLLLRVLKRPCPLHIITPGCVTATRYIIFFTAQLLHAPSDEIDAVGASV
ncbi:hypothetical protein FACS1894184_14100 [Clostridia bacterium]|nr:hypothetical protein FACS1894184_14100 [Clostridia bacterium]